MVLGILVAICMFFTWLVASYQPPFPPRWIGVKYFLFEGDKTVSQEEINKIPKDLNAIQSAIMVLTPISPEAKEVLPAQMYVNTFTLSNKEAIAAAVRIAIAQYLAGTDPSKEDAARAVLSSPQTAVGVEKLIVAVTQSNNLPVPEEMVNEELGTRGKEITPQEYEEMQKKIMFAPTLPPQNQNDSSGRKISKKGIYRFYQDKASTSASPSASYKENYSDFLRVNNTLIPTRKGASPLVILNPGTYSVDDSTVISPVDFYLTLHTIEGIPYNRKSVGHGWVSLARKEEGVMYPMMTMSLFNLIDTDDSQTVEKGELTNIATHTNLGMNYIDDWERSTKMLNYIPIPNGPTRSRVAPITPEKAKAIIYMREWYFPQYSTNEYYEKYLDESLSQSNNIKDKAALYVAKAHLNFQQLMNKTFWGVVLMWMNNTAADVRYNGITSNCVAYSTEFWNRMTNNPLPEYDSRILKLVPVPGKLYKEMKPEEVIDLPDAETLPPEQQNVPYLSD